MQSHHAILQFHSRVYRPDPGLGRGVRRSPRAPARLLGAGGHPLRLLCPPPAGSSLSSESSPVSSPATNHSSPASTPKRVPMGPIIVPPGGHSVPSTPPVVTIAPTKTVNGVWRSESRQVSVGRGLGGGPDVPQALGRRPPAERGWVSGLKSPAPAHSPELVFFSAKWCNYSSYLEGLRGSRRFMGVSGLGLPKRASQSITDGGLFIRQIYSRGWRPKFQVGTGSVSPKASLLGV